MNYWIKLYIEILEDAKLAVLPDRLWRRFIECCLLAGKLGNNGKLPDTSQIAWILRFPTDEINLDLNQLAATGMIEQIPGGWNVVNFAKRQAASPDAERKRLQRDRERHGQYEDGVTMSVTKRDGHPSQIVRQINRLTESDTDTEADVDAESNDDLPNQSTPIGALENAFMGSAKLHLQPSPKAIGAYQRMIKAGVKPEDIIQAVSELDSKEYVIVGPWSIENAAIMVMRRRNGKLKDSDRNKYISGPYAEFVEH